MSKHTPGPWEVNTNTEAGQYNLVSPVSGRCFMECWSQPDFHNSGKDNAFLISAAPELLEALKAMLETVKKEPLFNNMKYDVLGIQVNKAITKAEGR